MTQSRRHLGSLLVDMRELTSKALNRFRRGPRTVLWTMSGGLGFANHLYLWLHAHIEQAQGRDYRVLVTEAQRPWLGRLPELRELTVEADEVAFSDRREWGHTPRLYQRFGVDYTRDQMHGFVRERLAPSLPTPLASNRTVLNIRRGDYYTAFREQYAMNLREYVATAITSTSPRDVLVVSDDPQWCALNLKDLLHNPEYATHDPWENFIAVATAKTLIGTNSTFSYWGGYIGDALQTEPRNVVMPWFHKRTINGGAADQLDPSWTIVTDVPGGWLPPE